MAIISQGLELMKPDYFHYLPLRWRQSERAGTKAGVTAPGPVATQQPQCVGTCVGASGAGGQPAPETQRGAGAHQAQRNINTDWKKITGEKLLPPQERKRQLQAVK